jgi:hypothetical protein
LLLEPRSRLADQEPPVDSQNKHSRLATLEATDEQWKQNVLDVSNMESLLEKLHARQLRVAYKIVTAVLPYGC